MSNCCNNYICRHCIGLQAKRAQNDEKYIIKCSHCYKDNFKLEDIDPNLDNRDIKYYTDTPFKYFDRPQSGISSQRSGVAVNPYDVLPKDFVTPGQDENLVGVVGELSEAQNVVKLPPIVISQA